MAINENILYGKHRYRVALSYVALDCSNGRLEYIDVFAHTDAQAIEQAFAQKNFVEDCFPLQAIEVYRMELTTAVVADMI